MLWPNPASVVCQFGLIFFFFFGWQGVIFSINYQPKLQRLCSVSDDRSIRVWQIHSASSNTECIPLSSLDWNYVHIEPLLTLYGHSARVWDAVLLSEKIISVGEVSIFLK